MRPIRTTNPPPVRHRHYADRPHSPWASRVAMSSFVVFPRPLSSPGEGAVVNLPAAGRHRVVLRSTGCRPDARPRGGEKRKAIGFLSHGAMRRNYCPRLVCVMARSSGDTTAGLQFANCGLPRRDSRQPLHLRSRRWEANSGGIRRQSLKADVQSAGAVLSCGERAGTLLTILARAATGAG